MPDSKNRKKILLLGGVKPACEIIKEAKRMGIETYVTDYLENSPAKKIADHAYMIDATKVDEVVGLCKDQGIDGVITGYVDLLLPYCQKICEILNKPFWGNADNISMSINKEKFKLACQESGVPVVPWAKATQENYETVIEEINSPVVIKPVDNSGSRGVYKCSNIMSAKEHIERALSYSKCGEVIIEKAMNLDNEFSAYYILNNGEYYLTAMGDRYVTSINDNTAPVGRGMLFPSIKLEKWIKTIDPSMKKFFSDNHMNNGFVFIQGFYENNEFYIHEIGYRLNGGFSYRIVEYFSHYNQVQQLIQFSLTGQMDKAEISKSNPFFKGYGMIVTATLKRGVLGEIRGVESIKRINGVLEFYQLHETGESLFAEGTTAQVFAYILCVAETSEQMKCIVSLIRDRLVVKDSNGNNMLNDIIEPGHLNFGR